MLPPETPAHQRQGELLALLSSFAGLDPPAWALEARVRERAAALQLSPEAYVVRVVEDGDELQRLVELLRVGETRFFRHLPQLEALKNRVLPSLAGAVAAWSAGCASGEEAWTLGILLAERGLPFSLLATDLSAPALARARQGRYPAAAVERHVPAPLVPRYFRAIGDERVLNDRLRGAIHFQTLNLLGSGYPRDLDLILCRNVLIYFDEARRAEVVARLVRALKPGGWLLVGYSETLRDCAELDGEAGALYRKREAGVPRATSSGVPARARPTAPDGALVKAQNAANQPIPAVLREPPATARLHAERVSAPPPLRKTLHLRGDYHDGQRLAAELRPLLAAAGDWRSRRVAVVDLDGASFLGDEAARVLRRAAEAAPHLELHATRPQVRRWLARHHLGHLGSRP